MTKRDDSLLAIHLAAVRAAVTRFADKGGWVMSSHVAMSMMMALFPFILFVVALAGSLSQNIPNDEVIDLVFGSWPEDVAAPIVSELRAVLASSNSGLITMGGVLAIYFASNGVDAVRVAMTRAYHDTDTRPYWKARLICIGLVVAGGAMVLLAAFLDLVLPIYTNMLKDAVPEQMTSWLDGVGFSWGFVIAMPALAVLGCHLILPGGRHGLLQILPGVILTWVLAALAGWGFSIYISRFASYSATYAGLAGAMAALIFLYLNAAILILGAEYNGALLSADKQRKAMNDT
ncbi:YihY/virulence factor BrkB family protein [Seohaeicola saemankumensis]|nr:YihY/virulence factor BrkB family protein [Seohaeicola saemankumensis]MCA0873324.1 YihY/virulence factor BrkB family protein [Seohaeicola saemankumensis]